MASAVHLQRALLDGRAAAVGVDGREDDRAGAGLRQSGGPASTAPTVPLCTLKLVPVKRVECPLPVIEPPSKVTAPTVLAGLWPFEIQAGRR